MSTRLRGAAAAVLIGMLLAALLASAASACSCAGIENPRAALADAAGAFVGVLEEVTGYDNNDGDDETSFHFRVEHAVKGEMGERIVVYSRGHGGMCGLEGRPGDRLAMFLGRDAAQRWTGSLCRMISPERLLAAAQPLPAPDGQGPPALVLGAAIGEHRSLLLDGHGRTLAYGAAPEPNAGRVAALDGCPGNSHVVEAMGSGYPESRTLLAVRALDGFRIERTAGVADVTSGDMSSWAVHAVQCRVASAEAIDVAVRSWGGDGNPSSVLRLEHGKWRVVWRGDDASVLLSDDARGAVTKKRDRIERVDLGTGAITELAAVETYDTPTLTPDGNLLAIVTMEGFRPAQLLVLDARTGATKASHRFASEVDGVAVQWVDNRNLAVVDHRARTLTFFDAALRTISTVGGWDAYRLLGAGGRAYGASFETGALLEATPRAKALRRMTVPDGATYAVLALPPPPRPKATTITTTTTAAPVRAEAPVETVPPPTLPEIPLPMAAPSPVVPASSTRPWAPAGAATVLLGAAVTAIALRHKSLMTQ